MKILRNPCNYVPSHTTLLYIHLHQGLHYPTLNFYNISAHWIMPVYSLCPHSIIRTYWLIWKGKYPDQWPFINTQLINLWKDVRRQLQSSHSLLSTTEVANQTKGSTVFFFFFCWESLNNRSVLNSTFKLMNIMDLQGLDRLSHLHLLNIVQLSIEVAVGNHVAITFSRLKSKPDKSKHHFEKLYKSNVSLKMIRIAIFN